MISDKQRRAVAARMREIMRQYPHGFLDNMIAQSILDVMGGGVTIGETVADLIDVPTTVLDLTETTRTVHGEEVHVWECRECGQSCEEMYGGYERCPHCGRKVVRTND